MEMGINDNVTVINPNQNNTVNFCEPVDQVQSSIICTYPVEQVQPQNTCNVQLDENKLNNILMKYCFSDYPYDNKNFITVDEKFISWYSIKSGLSERNAFYKLYYMTQHELAPLYYEYTNKL